MWIMPQKIIRDLRTKVISSASHLQESTQFFPLIVFTALGTGWAILSGADSSFDYLNYHLYNGWATFRDSSSDFLPTSIWTYFPSHLDFIYYQIWSFMPSVAICFLVGGFQGLIGYFIYQIVQSFEEKKSLSELSYRGLFFGTLALSSPLVRAQFGNSMHDLTLCVLEFFLVKKIVFLNSDTPKDTLRYLALLLGLTLALKPSHLIAVVIIGIVMIFKPPVFEKIVLTLFGMFSFLFFSLPWVIKSFLDTKSPFFPYLVSERSGFLSGAPILHSYESWKINDLQDLLIHTMYPGGSSSVNHEINFLDITVPVVLIVFFSLILGKQVFTKIKELEVVVQKGLIFFGVGISIYVINQFVFTGIRYALVSYPLMITALAIFSFTKLLKWRSVIAISIILIAFVNLLPNSVYLPTKIDSVAANSVPDYGRTNHTFFNSQRSNFVSPYELNSGDLLILGQEQISFVAPLWNTEANVMGLQAYILGDVARQRMKNMILGAIASQHQAYLVTLRQNVSTMQSQLNSVDTRSTLSDCISVSNPFRRDVVVCEVDRETGTND